MTLGAAEWDAFLADQPEAWHPLLLRLRDLVLGALPEGYVEAVRGKMLCYEVPLAVSGKTYNGQPLMYAALSSTKRHVALYVMGVYCVPENLARFVAAHKDAGVKLDMGKACVRFKTEGDICAPALSEAIAAVPVDRYIEINRR